MRQVSERKYWIDYLRVFAMFSVVCVHMANIFYTQYGKIHPADWWVANIVDGLFKGNVCLFVMIAGCLLLGKEYNLRSFYLKRGWRLLIPFVFWTIFYVILRMSWGVSFREVVIHDLFILGAVTPHLWFFSMYICLMLFVPFINNFIMGRKPDQSDLRILLIIIFFFFCLNQMNDWILGVKSFGMEWFEVFPWFIGYLLAGYYVDRYAERSTHSNLAVISVIILLSCAGVFLNYLACTYLKVVDDSFILGKTGVIIFLRCVCIYYLFRKNFHRFKSPKWVVTVSGTSFGVYLIHPFIADLLKGRFSNYFADETSYLMFLIAMVSVLSFVAIYWIRKLPFAKHIM